MNTFTVGAVGADFTTITAAINAAAAGDTIIVRDGVYDENVVITKALTIEAETSRGATIRGQQAGSELGAVVLEPGLTGVTIRGFVIEGINGNGAIEKAALYMKGAQTGHLIADNEIVANGDHGLASEFNGVLTDITIDGNTFSGQTFEGAQPGGIGFGTQFDVGNDVPRQLVVLGNGGTAPQASSGIVFTDNTVSGTTGGISSDDGVSEQGNTMVTIDARDSLIEGNTFTGETARFATALRARGPNTDILNNTFDNSGGGDTRGVSIANAGLDADYAGNVFVAGATDPGFAGTPGDDLFTMGPTRASALSVVDVQRVSTAADGTQGNGSSFTPVFSPDGSKVAFASSATNLVPGDTTVFSDIFVKDLATGAITRVSTAADGTQGNNPSSAPVFSPDGSKVAFVSSANILVPGDTNSREDIFVKDLATGAITRISTAADGTQGNGASLEPVFSPDGTKVAFQSRATTLVPGDTNGFGEDIYVKDLATGAITRVSTAADGTQGNDFSVQPVFSPDGSKVAFASSATNLVPGDTNDFTDIFVKDLATGAITRVSTAADGAQGNSISSQPVFSPDGTKVAFVSGANILVPGDTNSREDIFVKDLATGAITRVSTAADGTQGNNSSSRPVFSPDGSKVAFFSFANNLVPGDTNGEGDIFVKDLATGAITRVSTAADGTQGNFSSFALVFSPDGSTVAFSSNASNLVPGDTNSAQDVFVATLSQPAPGLTILGGDGVDTADFSGRTGRVTVDLAAGTATEEGGATDTLVSIERFIGPDAGLTVDGSGATADLTLIGGAGDDDLIGGSGNDVLDGGPGGTDALTGGAGTDRAIIADNNDGAGPQPYDPAAFDFSGITVTGGSASGAVIGPDGTRTLDSIEVITVANTGSATHVVLAGMSIQAAIDAAAAGDTIVVAAGTYAENVTVNKAVTILGAQSGVPGTDAARDPAGGTGETTIIGRTTITVADDVTLDGLRFLNDATTTGGGASNPTLQFRASSAGGDHVLANSVFFSTVAGGAVDDRAISSEVLGSGSITVEDVLVTGFLTGLFGTASWGRGLWFDGGGVTLAVSGGRFQYSRTALNIDVAGASAVTVDGVEIVDSGTGVSGGLNAGTILANLTNLSFQNVGTEFNFRNLATDTTFDADIAVASVTPGGDANNDIVVVLGGAGSDDLSGTEGADALDGNGLSSTATDADVLSGRGGNDTLAGKGGDDRLDGGEGNDALFGGNGVDTAVFAGDFEDFSITLGATTTTVVDTNPADGDEGTDTLGGVERLEFADTDVLIVGAGGFATIQAAIDAASAGDTILVAAGTYAETLVIGKALTIAGSGVGATVIGPASGTAVTLAAGLAGTVTLEGLTLEGGGTAARGISVAPGAEAALTLRDAAVTGFSTFGLYSSDNGQPATTPGLTALTVENVAFSNNGFGGANGAGHVKLFGFDGAASFTGVTIAGADGAATLAQRPDNAIEIVGNIVSEATSNPAPANPPVADVSIDGVTVTGTFHKNAVALFHFSDLTDLSIVDLDLSGVVRTGLAGEWGPVFNLDGITAPTIDASGYGITYPAGVPIVAELQGEKAANQGGPFDQTITGSGANEQLNGKEGADSLDGGSGNDVLIGGVGNDALTGGDDTDAAIYAGARGEFTVTTTTNTAGFVTGFTGVDDTDTLVLDEGTDTLDSVELLRFSNYTSETNDDVVLDLAKPVQTFDAGGQLIGTFDTIQAGVDAAPVDGTVRVAAGSYAEAVTISTAGVSILGANVGVVAHDAGALNAARGPEAVVIGGFRVGADGVTIDGFEISGGTEAVRAIAGGQSLDDLTIANLYIHDTTDSPIRFGLGFGGGLDSENWTISGNLIDGIAGDARTGMVLFNVDGLAVTDNVILHDDAARTGRRGINLDGVRNADVSGNTLDFGAVANTAWAIQLGMSDRSISDIVVDGNTIADVALAIFTLSQRSATGVDITNNTLSAVTNGILLNSGSAAPAEPQPVQSGITVSGNTVAATSNAIFLRDIHDTNANGPVTFEDVEVSGNTVTSGIVRLGGADSLGGALLDIAGTVTVEGSAQNDRFEVEGTGELTVSAGGGNDTVTGGAGVDTAVYAGNFANFTVALGPTSVTVTDTDPVAAGDEGSDTLDGVEILSFADQDRYVYLATPDAGIGAEDLPTFVDVLANDGDFNDDGLVNGADRALSPNSVMLEGADTPTGKTKTVAGEGVWTVAAIGPGGRDVLIFQPETDFFGAATPVRYTVAASDGVRSLPTLVTLVVGGNPDTPVNTVPAAATVAEDGVLAFTGPLAVSVADPDDEIMTTSLSVSNGILTVATGGGADVAGNGTASVTVVGTVAEVNAALAGLSYAPEVDFNGADTLVVQTSDGTLTDTDNVAITVASVNDLPVISGDLALAVSEGATVVLTVDDLSAADVESGPGDLTFAVSGETNGQVLVNNVAASSFTQQDLIDGLVSFAHDGSETIGAFFGVVLADGDGASLPIQTVSVTVAPVNDAPTLSGDFALTVGEGGEVLLTGTDLAAADAESGPSALTFAVSGETNGEVRVNGIAASSFTQQDLIDGLVSFVHDGSETVAASFDVVLSDGDGASLPTQTVSVAVTPQQGNTLLVRVGGTGSITTPPRFEVLADGNSLGVFNVTTPAATFAGLVYENLELDIAGPAPETVIVRYLNDGNDGIDRNLWVDYIEVNGERVQSETDAVYVRSNGTVIGPSERMLWNGDLIFDDLAPPPPPTSTRVELSIGGTGTTAVPARFSVTIDGVNYGAFDVTAPAATNGSVVFDQFVFDVPTESVSDIAIAFINDGTSGGVNRNLFVDYAEVDGVRFEAEVDGVYIRQNGQVIGPTQQMLWSGTMFFEDLGPAPETTTVLLRVGGTGTTTTPAQFSVTIDNQSYGIFSVTNPAATNSGVVYDSFIFEVNAAQVADVKIEFVNDGVSDGVNRNLFVDYIEIDNVRIEAEIGGEYVRSNGTVIGPTQTMLWAGVMTFDDFVV